MKHFSRLPLKAYIVLLSCLKFQQTDTALIKGNLPDISAIANFFNDYIKPIVDKHGVPTFRANVDNSFINKVIHNKVEQLKPILQDNDPNDEHNTVTLEGKDDTHILEFLPNTKQVLRFKNQTDNVEKFKKMRKKIKKALKKEPISEDTKQFISKSVDEMVAHIVSNKCVWTSGKAGMRQGNGDGKPFTFKHMWNHLWNKIKTRYKKVDRSGERKNNLNFFNDFQKFVSEILNDTQILSEDYRVVCSVVNINSSNVTGIKTLRNNQMNAKSQQRKNTGDLRPSDVALYKKDIDDNDACPYFKVCSEELSDFMTDFYINVNDIAASTLTNYAAMFIRDVKEDNKNEKQTVIKLINDTISGIAKKINIIFKKQTDKFTLVKSKDKDSNVNALRNFIKKTVNHVKRQVINDVAYQLKELRPKLRLTIEKDIDVNLDVDLGNLERELSAKICMVFKICNGNYVSSRSIDYSSNKINKNHLFVRVQLTLDDKKIPVRRIAVGVGQAMKGSGLSTPYNRYINVTRTDAPINTLTQLIKNYTPLFPSNIKLTSLITSNINLTTSVPSPVKKPTLGQGNVKLMSAETDKNNAAIKVDNKHVSNITVKLEEDNTDKNIKTQTTIFTTTEAHETYFENSEIKTQLNITVDEHANKKKHRAKNHNGTKKKNNKTHVKQFKTIKSPETYRKPYKENISEFDKTIDEHAKKQKLHVKKHKGTKKNYSLTQTNKLKTIESLDTYRQTHKENFSELNMTLDEHENTKNNHIKTHNGNIYLNSQDDTKCTAKSEKDNTETYNQTQKVHDYVKPSYLLGNQGKTDNVKEFNFNITVGRLAINQKHHITEHKSSKKHKNHTIESKEGKNEIKSGDVEIIYRSQDLNNTESCKVGGTQEECINERRYNNQSENTDDVIDNANFNTIQEQTDRNTESVEDNNDYEYTESTEIYDQNANDAMYEEENEVKNELDSLKNEKDDVKVWNIKKETFVDVDEK